MGTLNFGVFEAARKIKDWKYDWEKPFLEASRSRAMSNSFAEIEAIASELGGRFGTRFEFECYDVGHLYNLAHFADRGLVRPPFLIQCIFGVLGGVGADAENLTHMVRIADKLFGEAWYLSVLGAGRHRVQQFQLQGAQEVVLEVRLDRCDVGELLPHPDQGLVVRVGSHGDQGRPGLALGESAEVVAEHPQHLFARARAGGQLQQGAERGRHDRYKRHWPRVPFPARIGRWPRP